MAAPYPLGRTTANVAVATSVLLTFISFWWAEASPASRQAAGHADHCPTPPQSLPGSARGSGIMGTTEPRWEARATSSGQVRAGVLSQNSIFGQNPKIGCQEFNDLQTPKLSQKQLCEWNPTLPITNSFSRSRQPRSSGALVLGHLLTGRLCLVAAGDSATWPSVSVSRRTQAQEPRRRVAVGHTAA